MIQNIMYCMVISTWDSLQVLCLRHIETEKSIACGMFENDMMKRSISENDEFEKKSEYEVTHSSMMFISIN